MEKTYYWEYGEYHFELFVGDDGTRWDDEGILQSVKLSVNGIELINNNWGIEHNLYFITNGNTYGHISDPDATLNLYENGLAFAINNDLDSNKVVMYGEDYKEFIKWIKSCLSTKEERIKIKLEQLMNKKREA